MPTHLRSYGLAAVVPFSLYDTTGVLLKKDATFEAGDVKISKNDGVEANVINLPTDTGSGYYLSLSATEMSAARVVLYIEDQTTPKAFMSETIIIETYGNAASSQHPFDLGAAVPSVNLTKIDGVANASATLNLKKLNINNVDGNAIEVNSDSGNALRLVSTAGGSAVRVITSSPDAVISIQNNGAGTGDSGAAILAKSGTGAGARAVSIQSLAASGNGDALYLLGAILGKGANINGGASGIGVGISGVGAGLSVAATAGAGISVEGTTAGIYAHASGAGSAGMEVSGQLYGLKGVAPNLTGTFGFYATGESGGKFIGNSLDGLVCVGAGGATKDLSAKEIVTLLADTVLIKGYTDSLETSMTTALADLVTIKGYTDTVETTLANATYGLSAIKTAVNNVQTTTNTINTNTDTVEASLANATWGLLAIKTAVDGVQSTANTINTNTDTVEASLTSVLADTATLKADTATLKSYTDTIEASLADATIGLSAIKTAVNGVQSTANTINGNTDTLESSMITVLSDTALIKGYTDTVEASLANATWGLAAIKTAVDGVSTDVGNMGDDIATNLALSTAINGKVDIIDTNVDSSLAVLQSSTYGNSALKAAIAAVQATANAIDTDTNLITSKLPAGMLSDITLDAVIDGSLTIGQSLKMVAAMVNGRFQLNSPNPGQITFYEQDNTTALFTVNVTDNGRTRV